MILQRIVPVLSDQVLVLEVVLEGLRGVDLSEVELVNLLEHKIICRADASEAHRVIHQIKTGRIVTTIGFIRMDFIGYARLVYVEPSAVFPVKTLVNRLALRVPLHHRLSLFFDHDHIVIDDETAHEVVRQVAVPLLTHLQVEAGPQEVMYVISLVREDHSDQNYGVLLLEAIRCSKFLHSDGTLVLLGVVPREPVQLTFEEMDQIRFCEFKVSSDLMRILVLRLAFDLAELLVILNAENALVRPCNVERCLLQNDCILLLSIASTSASHCPHIFRLFFSNNYL